MLHFNRRTVSIVFKPVQKIIDYILNLEPMKLSLILTLAILITCTFSGKPRQEITETDFKPNDLGSDGSLSKTFGSSNSSGKKFRGSLKSLFRSKGSDLGSNQQIFKKKSKKDKTHRDNLGNPLASDESRIKQIEEALQNLSKALKNLKRKWNNFRDSYLKRGNSMIRVVDESGQTQMIKLQERCQQIKVVITDLSLQVLRSHKLSTVYKQQVQEQIGSYTIICAELAENLNKQAQNLVLRSSAEASPRPLTPRPKFARLKSDNLATTPQSDIVMKFSCGQPNPNNDLLAQKMLRIQQVTSYLYQVCQAIEHSFGERGRFKQQFTQEMYSRMEQVEGVINTIRLIDQGVRLYSEQTTVSASDVRKALTDANRLHNKFVQLRAKNWTTQSSQEVQGQELTGRRSPFLKVTLPRPTVFNFPTVANFKGSAISVQ